LSPPDGAIERSGERVLEAGETALASRFAQVRAATLLLTTPLSAEDQTVQSMPDCSPVKWHQAHTAWFFETFLLVPNDPDYQPFDPLFGYLFNSYYETVGPRRPRPERGLVTRPSLSEVRAYRRHVDAAMAELLAGPLGRDPAIAALVELGLAHEQQHQELILMDVLHLFAQMPGHPAYRPMPADESGDPGPMGRILVRGEPGHDIIPELAPAPNEPVVDKPGKGAFYATDLETMLRGRDIARLLVCGVTTEVCVNTTVREANDRGFDCLVLEDCTGSYFPEFQAMGLAMIKAQDGIFGWVAPSAALLAVLA